MSFKEELKLLVKNSFIGDIRKAVSETFPSKDLLRKKASQGYENYEYIRYLGRGEYMFGETTYLFDGDVNAINSNIYIVLEEELKNRGIDINMTGTEGNFHLYWC